MAEDVIIFGLKIEVCLLRAFLCAFVVGTLPMASLGFLIGSGLSRLPFWVACPLFGLLLWLLGPLRGAHVGFGLRRQRVVYIRPLRGETSGGVRDG